MGESLTRAVRFFGYHYGIEISIRSITGLVVALVGFELAGSAYHALSLQ